MTTSTTTSADQLEGRPAAWRPPWRREEDDDDDDEPESTGLPGRARPLPRDRWRWEAAPVGLLTSYRVDQLGGRELLDAHAGRCRVELRAACRPWLRRLYRRGGGDRWARVRYCGRLALGWCPELDLRGVVPLWCRDRACPVCTAREARRRSASAGWLAEARGLVGPGSVFVTLTQARRPESAKEATDRLYATMRALAQSRRGRAMLAGVSYLRATEIVYRPWRAGARGVKNAGAWHPHFHAVVTGVGEDWAADFVRLWLHHSKGAHARGQHFAPVRAGFERELLKYALKADDLPPVAARLAYDALAGRRLVAAAGDWKGWRTAGPKLPAMAIGVPIDDAPGEHDDDEIGEWIAAGRLLPELVAEAAGADEIAAEPAGERD